MSLKTVKCMLICPLNNVKKSSLYQLQARAAMIENYKITIYCRNIVLLS